MANKKLSDGVGKKIVEALKKQSEIEINPASEKETQEENIMMESFNTEDTETQENFQNEEFLDSISTDDYTQDSTIDESESFINEEPISDFNESPAKPAEKPFVNYKQPMHSATDNLMKELDNFEIPSNIAVLKKLISQLPNGVTKHTGAQIIKQTMEALGISMKNVLQEAQQVQDGLSSSAKECHANIQEYKKQITVLEKQAQNYQRHYGALNELISLFIQTGV